MAGSRCWSTLRRSRLHALPAAYSDHKSDHHWDHDCLVRGIAALGCFRAAELAFEATLLGRLGAAALALGAALLGSFRAAAALLGSFRVAAALLGGLCAAPALEAATFDSAAFLAPAALAALLGIALSFATPGLLFGIAPVAGRAFALFSAVVAFERDAALLFGRELGVSAATLCMPRQPRAASRPS